jgi:hypothetical protein
MVMAMVLFGTEVLGSEPAADGFAAQVDGELIGQCLGKVGEVEVEAVFAVDADDPLLQTTGFGVGWGAAVVAVAYAIDTASTNAGLEAEDLAATQAEHLGGHGSTECRDHGLLDNAVALHILLRVTDWLWHAASIPARTPEYDIIALPLAYDIIALRPHLNLPVLTEGRTQLD